MWIERDLGMIRSRNVSRALLLAVISLSGQRSGRQEAAGAGSTKQGRENKNKTKGGRNWAKGSLLMMHYLILEGFFTSEIVLQSHLQHFFHSYMEE